MKKTYEDYLTLVIDGELKKRLRIVATMQGKSINNWFNETMTEPLRRVVDEEYNRVTAKIIAEKAPAKKPVENPPA